MKAVLMSIRPQWCEKIFNGSKTIEIRKSRPSIPTPFTVYVYHTKTRDAGVRWNDWADCLKLPTGEFINAGGKVIGEFVCDRIDEFDSEWSERAYACAPTDIQCTMPMSEENAIKICKEKGCMTLEDIIDYFGDEEWRAYFWHISDLKIYDKPKELGEFSYPAEHNFTKRTIKESREMGFICHGVYITRPPQSWVYCEPIEEE